MNQTNKTHNSDPNCIFCKIIKKEIPAVIIYEDEDFIAFLDLEPINPGHTVLIPKNHSNFVWDMSEDELTKALPVSKKIALALKQTYNPTRLGLFVEGFDIDHAHIKLIPLNSPDDIKNTTTAISIEEREEEAKKIEANL